MKNFFNNKKFSFSRLIVGKSFKTKLSKKIMVPVKNITVEVKDKLAVITLSNPRKKNAINPSMYTDLTEALESLSENEEVSVTALTATGEYYCSGTDLQFNIFNDAQTVELALKQNALKFRRFIEAFINHSKVLVAVVNGPAIGVGTTTLALCDIVYSIDTATFQVPFTKLGMSPEGCSTYTFPYIMGSAKANNMLLFNQKLTAKEAFDAGLISQLFTKEQLETVVWPELRKKAMELPSKSLEFSKKMIRGIHLAKLHEANRIECDRLVERWNSEEFRNAIINFFTRSKI